MHRPVRRKKQEKTPPALWKKVLFCTLIAAIMCSYWYVAHPREANLMARLELYGLPEFLTIVQHPSKTFEVRVRGNRSAIDKLSGRELTYPVSLADWREGVQSIIIDSEKLGLPEGVSVVRVSTGDTTVKLEKLIQKRLPVVPRVTGNPAFGYRVAEKTAYPFSLVLQGPESKIAPMDSVITHPLDVSGASETIRKEITLDLPEGVIPQPFQRSLDATVFIEEDRTEKTYSDIAVKGLNCAFRYIIRPERVALTVNGAVRAFADPIPAEKFSVYLDLNGLSPGIYAKPATIDLPDGIQLVRADPQVFTVEIINGTKRGG